MPSTLTLRTWRSLPKSEPIRRRPGPQLTAMTDLANAPLSAMVDLQFGTLRSFEAVRLMAEPTKPRTENGQPCNRSGAQPSDPSGSPQLPKSLLSLMARSGFGALGEIRTPDPQIRSLVLYPAELRARMRQASRRAGSMASRRHKRVNKAFVTAWQQASRSSRLLPSQMRGPQLFHLGHRFTLTWCMPGLPGGNVKQSPAIGH